MGVGLLQQIVGLLRQIAVVIFYVGHPPIAGDGFPANSEMKGDDRGPVEG